MDSSTNARESSELIALLRRGDPDKREEAANLLGKAGNGQAVIPLIDTLHDSASLVRSRSAQSLGIIGDTRAVPPLIACLGDSDVSVRIEAAIALGRIGGRKALDTVASLITNRREDGRLRAFSVRALGSNLAQVEPYLDVLLEAAEDTDDEVQQAAIEVLSHINNVRIVEVFIGLLQDRFDVLNDNMMDVISNLGDRRHPKAVEVLVNILAVDHMVYRELAAEALGKIGDPRAVPALESMLRDTKPDDDPRFYPQLVRTTKKSLEAIRATRGKS